MNDGDWICPDANCANLNFARRATCYRCSKDRPEPVKQSKKKLGTEIGKSAAERSRGLFNADDWQCNKCANVNWARRQTCNVCNAPKFGEVEERTGYGGGYNERGNVEYRRREESSEDEYDEFGRIKKNRKRSHSHDKVGVTEGPVHKIVPPTVLHGEQKTADLSQYKYYKSTTNGSLSDGSVCELPPLNKAVFKRNQIPNCQTFKQDLQRKRSTSSGDRAGSGYETAPKSKLRGSKPYDPVVESCVSSTNGIALKMRNSTSADEVEEKYSLEERVRLAALAIAYSNCKIASDKFTALYKKPAPDFQTIFAMRQQLLITGCMVDSHREKTVKEYRNDHPMPKKTVLNHKETPPVKKLKPNPEEIVLDSDSEDDCATYKHVKNQFVSPRKPRSVSVETVRLDNIQKLPAPARSIEDNHSCSRSESRSTRRSRSSSSVETVSDSDDNDRYTKKSPSLKTNSKKKDTESELSDGSDETDFLSRRYKKNKKCKMNSNVSTDSQNKCAAWPFQVGVYNTVPSVKQSPLVTGNIYTNNLRNMNVRRNNAKVNKVNKVNSDYDGYASEYVPTKVGTKTKNNYQEFKDKVKKGYWAKGNGKSIGRKVEIISNKVVNNQELRSILNKQNGTSASHAYVTTQNTNLQTVPANTESNYDFTRDEIDNCSATQNYMSFDRDTATNCAPAAVVEANTSSIFEMVQGDTSANKSILDIFGKSSDDYVTNAKSSTDLSQYDSIRKKYENQWDEDDDALYQTEEPCDVTLNGKAEKLDLNGTDKTVIPKIISSDFVNQKKGQLLGLLTDANPCSQSVNLQKEEMQQHVVLPEVNLVPIKEPKHKIQDSLLRINKYSTMPDNIDGAIKRISESDRNGVAHDDNVEIDYIPSVASTPTRKSKSSEKSESFHSSPAKLHTPTKKTKGSPNVSNGVTDEVVKTPPQTNEATAVSLSTLLANINTDTLLLALQNLKQLSQTPNVSQTNIEVDANEDSQEAEDADKPVETINLTDEDWENDSNREGSIERELKKLDGNSGDTPFLSDMFDPGPVVIPPTKKLSLNLKVPSLSKSEENNELQSEDTPVIGNFKSFALPKPIMLNRLKLCTTKEVKKSRKKSKKKSGGGDKQGTEEAEDDEEESGDEGDLSKYDLWGSEDEKQGTSNKPAEASGSEKVKETDEAESSEKNGKTQSPEKGSKKRSRSSSSSSTSSSSSSSSHGSSQAPKNRFDDFNLNSERESSPKGGRRSRSPRSRSASGRRKSRDSRSAGESRYDKERSRDRERRDKSRGDRRDRHYYGARTKHR